MPNSAIDFCWLIKFLCFLKWFLPPLFHFKNNSFIFILCALVFCLYGRVSVRDLLELELLLLPVGSRHVGAGNWTCTSVSPSLPFFHIWYFVGVKNWQYTSWCSPLSKAHTETQGNNKNLLYTLPQQPTRREVLALIICVITLRSGLWPVFLPLGTEGFIGGLLQNLLQVWKCASCLTGNCLTHLFPTSHLLNC